MCGAVVGDLRGVCFWQTTDGAHRAQAEFLRREAIRAAAARGEVPAPLAAGGGGGGAACAAPWASLAPVPLTKVRSLSIDERALASKPVRATAGGASGGGGAGPERLARLVSADHASPRTMGGGARREASMLRMHRVASSEWALRRPGSAGPIELGVRQLSTTLVQAS